MCVTLSLYNLADILFPKTETRNVKPSYTQLKETDDSEATAPNDDKRRLVSIERSITLIENTLGTNAQRVPTADSQELDKDEERKKDFGAALHKARDVAIKFVFAWSVTDILEAFFFSFLEECGPVSSCAPRLTFYFALGVSFGLFQWVWIIAVVDDENNKYVDKLFQLQIQAAPLNVGFAWKRFMDALNAKISSEWPQAQQWATFMVVSTFYIFVGFAFHMYRVIAADMRMKPLDVSWKSRE
jgi:hypothetical protein